MGRKKVKRHPVVINYPPVTTKTWIPPDQRKKKKIKRKYPPYPPQLHTKGEISTLTKIWHSYRLIHGCAVLLGNRSQNHHKYSYVTNGYQGTSNCVMAILLSKLIDCSYWNPFVLDHILDLGDCYYLLSRKQHVHKRILKLADLSRNLYVYNHHITLCLSTKRKYKGLIYQDVDNIAQDYLGNVLTNFFKDHEAGIISTAGNVGRHFATWKCSGGYFLFDPTDHDYMCWPWKDILGKGVCFLIRFPNVDKMLQVIHRNLTSVNVEFEMVPIAIERIITVNTVYPDCLLDANLEGAGPNLLCTKPPKTVEDQPPEPVEEPDPREEIIEEEEEGDVEEVVEEKDKVVSEADQEPESKKTIIKKRKLIDPPRVESVTFFNYVIPDRIGIILADMHAGDLDFCRCQGKQGICNAVAALVMLRESKAKYWTTNIVTNTLRLGYRICVESKRILDVNQVFQLENVVRRIVLNEKSYSPVITKYGAIGRLGSVEESVLDLLPALKEVFSECDTVVLQGPLIVAIWKENDNYFMFDPYERDPNGFAIVKEIRVGSVMEAVDYCSGVACLTWFRDLRDLIEMYMRNVSKPSRRDQFVISNVEIKDYMELPENWMNFQAICPDRWILRGHFSQSDRKFDRTTRNTQCTANCVIAISYAHIVPIANWTVDTIDTILNDGDTYYKQCVSALEKKEKFVHNMLLVAEVLDTFIVDNKLVYMDVFDCVVNGLITIPDDYKTCLNLKMGLEEFFSDNDYGILTCRGISVAIWKRGDAFYYFDSHDRNEQGFYLSHGKACVQRITTINKMANCIMANLAPESIKAVYNLSRIDVEVFNPVPPDEPMDEDDYYDMMEAEEDDTESDPTAKFNVELPYHNYTKITKKRAILRSHFDQNNPMFGTNAGKQTVPNMFAAIGMSRVISPETWNVETLNDVLRRGNEMYNDSIEEYYRLQATRNLREEEDEDEGDDITIDNVLKDFKIGVNKFTVELQPLTSGVIGVDGEIIKDAIKNTFDEEPTDIDDYKEIVVHTNNFDVVVWKKGRLYYLFDPRAKDERGDIYGKEEWSEYINLAPIEPEPEPEPPMSDVTPDVTVAEDEIATEELLPSDAPAPIPATDEEIENFLVEEWKELGENVEEEGPEPIPPIPKHPLEYWQELEREQGRACILWFTKPKYLIKHIIANNPPKLREEEECTITRIVMKNLPDVKDAYDPEKGPKEESSDGDWKEFKEITKGQWILRGTIHQKDIMFPLNNRGLQSAANSAISLAFAHLYAISKYDQRTVDAILKYGDRLFTATKHRRRKELEKMNELALTPGDIDDIVKNEIYGTAELMKKFCIGDDKVTTEVELDYITGEVHAQDIADEMDVLRGLQAFFEQGEYAVISAKGNSAGIWKTKTHYYMFDPCDRGPYGFGFENGVACITRFVELEPLAKLFLKNLSRMGKNFFTIHNFAIDFEDCNKPIKAEIRRVDDPLKIVGFSPVSPGKFIVCGTISQDDTVFGRGTNAQSAPIGMVALAMTLIHNCEYWTKSIVDEIIRVGDGIYGDLLERCDFDFNPWEEKLTVAMAPNDFKIGKIKVNCELRHTEQSGIIDIKDPNIINIRQGIERFFDENCFGIIETDFLTVAVWESEDVENNNFIYMLDPNPRSRTGQPMGEEGTACALKFCGSKLLADHIISLVHSERDGPFLITPVEMVIEYKGKKRKTKKYGLAKKKPDPTVETNHTKKLGRFCFYKIPGGELEILRGCKSQNCTEYLETSRGNQDVPNCIIAYIMDKLIPICKWNYKTIDNILDAGDQLYKDSYIIYNPKEKKLRLETLIRDIILKDVRVKISVGAPILTARFEERFLTEALLACFNLKYFCIVLVDKNAVAIFRKEDTYYLFDPNDLNLHGNRVECGNAAVMRFCYIELLIGMLMSNMRALNQVPEVFHIIVVAIKEIEKVPPGTTFMELEPKIIKQEPKFNNCDKSLMAQSRNI